MELTARSRTPVNPPKLGWAGLGWASQQRYGVRQRPTPRSPHHFNLNLNLNLILILLSTTFTSLHFYSPTSQLLSLNPQPTTHNPQIPNS